MSPELLQKLERLQGASIELVPFNAMINHYLLARGGFVALVEKVPKGFGKIGAPGIMTQKGFACLIWRESEAFFVTKGFDQQATIEQIEGLRMFSADLHQALAD